MCVWEHTIDGLVTICFTNFVVSYLKAYAVYMDTKLCVCIYILCPNCVIDLICLMYVPFVYTLKFIKIVCE